MPVNAGQLLSRFPTNRQQFIERDIGVSVTFISRCNVFVLQLVARSFLPARRCNCPSPPRMHIPFRFASLPLRSFFLFLFFLFSLTSPVRAVCRRTKLSKSIERFRRPGPTSVSARNPLKYTGPFLLTPYTRELKRDSSAGRDGKKGGHRRTKNHSRPLCDINKITWPVFFSTWISILEFACLVVECFLVFGFHPSA